MASVEPDINAYGTYGRVEALADWLELAALAGRRVTSAQLEAMIADNGWTRLSPRQYLLPAAEESDSPPEAWVEAVFQAVAKRQSVLRDAWPYEIRGDWRIIARAGELHTPYNALLALTVAHAWGVPTAHRPEEVFENTVTRALQDHGIAAVGIGTAAGSGTFATRAAAAASRLGLPFAPELAPMKASARDEGTDTLALVGWPQDDRPAGQWVFVGQSTMARSNEWHTKLMEPRVSHWARRLHQPLDAIRFLAVPHHAASEFLRHLVGPDTGVVVDRLRITSCLRLVSGEERSVLDAVVAAGVSDGRAAA